MDIQIYNKLIIDNKTKNLALSRTNINVEALKKRIRIIPNDANCFAQEFGNELLLILMNYIVQKYYKDYGVLSFSDGDERVYFYTLSEIDLKNTIAIADIGKSRQYLSGSVLENSDMLGTIIKYAIDGFGSLEKDILKGIKRTEVKECLVNNAERVLIIYQIITVGSCLGYFDVILDEKSLQSSDKFIMKYFNTKQFLIKYINGFCKIDIQSGDLVIANRVVKFKKWSNYSVGSALEYILSIIAESNSEILMLQAQVGGFAGQSFNVKIDMERKIARYTSYDYGFSNERIKEISLTEGGLKEFIYTLYELKVQKW